MRFSRLQHDQFLQTCKWCKDFWAIKINQYIISSKSANSNTQILILVIFFRSSDFFVNLVIFAKKPVAALQWCHS